MQKRARGTPGALDRGGRVTHHLRGFLHRQSSEESQLDDLGLIGIERLELLQRGIQSDDVDRLLVRDRHGVLEQDFLTRAAAPRRMMLARVIEQDASHLGRRYCQKVSAVFERRTLVDKADVGFMNQGRGLQGVLATLAAEVGAGQTMQLVIHQRQELVDGVFIATSQIPQQARDFALVACVPGHIGTVTSEGIEDNLDRYSSMFRTNKFRQITVGRAAVGANAVGALAVGALAIGALAIGRLVIGRLMVGKANAKSVSIEDLTIARLRVGELTVTDSFTTPEALGRK
jgi:hypothetical protein